MSKPFVFSKESQGRWLNLGDIRADGTRIAIKVEDGRMLVRRSIDPKLMQHIEDTCTHSKDIWRKGRLLGKQKRHWLPVARMSLQMREQWTRELGPIKENPAAWKRRFNSSDYRNIRTSEHTV